MIYVGYKRDGTKEVFTADAEPVQGTHGHVYYAALGPFKTMRAAKFAASWQTTGPHPRENATWRPAPAFSWPLTQRTNITMMNLQS
jgi:hypothetical protein